MGRRRRPLDRRTAGAAAFHAATPVRLDAGMPVSADREELFELRVERRRRDLVEALETLYGHDAALPARRPSGRPGP